MKRIWIDLHEDSSFRISSPDNGRTCKCGSLRELYKELPLEISTLQAGERR